MIQKQFGRTGEKLSILGYGCMRLPTLEMNNARIDEPRAMAMLRRSIDQGINYIDTAWPYHSSSFSEPGSSEPFVGKVLRDGYREKVQLATKLPCWLVEKAEDLEHFLDQQLERLETDRIDFYLLHSLNRQTWPKMRELGALKFLDRALESGKIRYAGFSFHDELPLFKEIVDAYPWAFTQLMYNYYDEHFQAGAEGMRYAAERGLGIVVMEPLRGGALVRGIPREGMQVFQQVRPGRSPVEWALQWLWKQEEVGVVLSGMSAMEQVEENLKLAAGSEACPWTLEDERAVHEVQAHIRALQRVPCTSCGYCLPCPEGVDIPKNFAFVNDHHMLKDPSARHRYHHFLKDPQRASACVQCGQCLEHCPQQIAIPDELEHVAEVFSM